MRTHRHAELRGHQHHREVFVHAAEPAAVDLAEADRLGLQELLEHHAVGAVFAGRDADRPDRPRDRGVPEDVVRARGLLDPERVESREVLACARWLRPRPTAGSRRPSASRSGPIASRTIPTRRASSFGIGADLDLEMRPAFGDGVTTRRAHPVVRVTHPSDRRRVRRIARPQQLALRDRPWSAPGGRASRTLPRASGRR